MYRHVPAADLDQSYRCLMYGREAEIMPFGETFCSDLTALSSRPLELIDRAVQARHSPQH